jgi:hypothetical protein
MIAVDAVQRAIILVKNYGPYVCVPIFLLIAFIYLNSTHPQYRVTARIGLRGVSPQSAVADLQSKSTVKKVIDQLPLQASYYDSESPREEISASELKARLVFDRPSHITGEAWVRLDLSGSDVFTLTYIDTTAWYEFNKPITESYGDFKIVHSAKYDHVPVSYLVRLQDANALFTEYSNNLKFDKNTDESSVTMAIMTGTPEKGIEFLNMMIRQYSNGSLTNPHYARINNVSVLHRARVTLLEKPESNVEPATAAPFWIYLAAVVAGLMVPLGIKNVRARRRRKISLRDLRMPKFAVRLQQRVSVR